MNIQLILVLLLVASAATFLGIRFYKMFFKKNKAGDCPGCASSK